MIRIMQYKVSLDTKVEEVKDAFLKSYNIPESDLVVFRIKKESLDARKDKMQWVYAIEFALKNEYGYTKKYRAFEPIEIEKPATFRPRRVDPSNPPLIIGMGPAGLFCAYFLALHGQPSIIIERGEEVVERSKSVKKLWALAQLNPESNVQFGEGGAGTFSDGKLTTRIKDPRSKEVLEILEQFGAPGEILFKQKPHIGTDVLKNVIINMRNWLIEKGVEIHYNTRMTELIIENNSVKGIVLNDGRQLKSDRVILATGHSARDTYQMLYDKGIALTAKPFAMGLRIEHSQRLINTSQYGIHADHPRLAAAEYQLMAQSSEGRGIYTFCMCPGGYVVNSSSEAGKLSINGMSYNARTGVNANSALLVSVYPEDFEGDHPLRGMYAQQSIEEAAFIKGGGGYLAPVQRVDDFLAGRASEAIGQIKPSIKPGYVLTKLDDLYPESLTNALKDGLTAMGKKLKGFDAADSILTGVETRTSAPVRIVRDEESLESTSHKGIYPIGEGAGYSGGIMSSAVDGLKMAEKLLKS